MATIASLIVDINANTVDLIKGTKDVQASLNSMEGFAKKAGSALAGVFTINTLTGFARELLDMADDIVRTADRTGLLTSEVQKLSYIAEQSGNTIEQLTQGIGQMQNRLASGDKSAVSAVKQLGLSFEDLRKQGPYEQLESIAVAIEKIPNPATRAQVAMDLFGKSGIAMLPTLIAHFKELGDQAPLMADNTVRALDDAGDALNYFGRQLKVFAAESYNNMGQTFDILVAGMYRMIAGFYKTTAELTLLVRTIPGASKVFGDLKDNVVDLTSKAQWYTDAAKGLETHTASAAGAVRAAVPAFSMQGDAARSAAGHTTTHAKAMKEAAVIAPEMQHAMDLLAIAHKHQAAALEMEAAAYKSSQAAVENYLQHLPRANVQLVEGVKNYSAIVPLIGEAAQATGNLATVQAEATRTAGEWSGAMKNSFADFLGSVTRAFTGGGFLSGIKNFGMQTAAEFTAGILSAIPGIGPILAQFAGPLVEGFKKIGSAVAGIFDRNKGRDIVEDFVAGFGGFDAFHQMLGEKLPADAERLWIMLTQGVGRNNKDEARNAIAVIQKALEGLGSTFKDTLGDIGDAIDDLPKDIDVHVNTIWDSTGKVPDGAEGFAGGGRVLPFASGGMAPRGTDTVPAMLTPGEIVLNAAQQRRVAGAIGGGDGSQSIAELRAQMDADRSFLLVQLPKVIQAALQRGAA